MDLSELALSTPYGVYMVLILGIVIVALGIYFVFGYLDPSGGRNVGP